MELATGLQGSIYLDILMYESADSYLCVACVSPDIASDVVGWLAGHVKQCDGLNELPVGIWVVLVDATLCQTAGVRTSTNSGTDKIPTLLGSLLILEHFMIMTGN